MYDAILAETHHDHRPRRRRDRGLLGPPARPGPARRRGRHPPHARLRRADQGDRPATSLRTATTRSCRTCTAARRRAPARTTPRPRRGPTAACPTTGWSATWPAPSAYLKGADQLQRQGRRRSATARAAASRSSPAVSLPLDAAVDCYGAFVVGEPRRRACRSRSARSWTRRPSLSCPLLGLFGEDDSYPSPEQVAELEEALKARRQDLRVPQLRGRRPRVLLRQPPGLPASRRPTTAGRRSSPSSASTCSGERGPSQPWEAARPPLRSRPNRP